jgi:3',5'-cyclic AMP phosphodiesterase CpdA
VFTAFGDHGLATPPPYTPDTREASRAIRMVQALSPAFHLHAGDLSYANGRRRVWDRWLRSIEPVARETPWMPCLGNHEMERPATEGGFSLADTASGPHGYDEYLRRFALPPNGTDDLDGAFYTFRWGGMRVVALDNNDVSTEFPANRGYTSGRQRRWIEQVLGDAARDPRVEAVVVVMHQPAFSSATMHGPDAGVREAWHDLFVRYGVTLVLQGHDHVYERSHPLDAAGDPAADGVVYITCGNAGLAEPGLVDPPPGWSAFRQDRWAGVVRVEVTPAHGPDPATLVVSHHAVDPTRPILDRAVVPARSRTASPAATSGR